MLYRFRILALCTSISILTACAGPPEPSDVVTPETTADQKVFDKLIYGDDDRKDLYEVISSLNKRLADSTVALMETSNLKALSANSFSLPVDTYGSQQMLCTSEPFYAQPAGAFCSGSLVGVNLILTAGHCIKDATDCANVRFLFGYAVKQSGKYPTSIATSEVYSCKRIVSRKMENAGADYALIEIDRSVVGHEALKLQRSKVGEVGDSLTVIGHPSGLPTKVAAGGKVRAVNSAYLISNLDTYGGNSGSGVFNSETGEIVGVLVRGDTDFIAKGSCYVSNRCPAEGCRGEDVTRIDQVSALIPEVATPLPRPTPIPVSVEKIFVSTKSFAIPDNSLTGIESRIQVPEAVAGRKVLIGVNIEHTYVGDLRLILFAPNGKNYTLRKNKGGRGRDLKVVFGESLVSEADLSGLSSAGAGEWKLKVIDSLSKDIGTLKEWKIALK